MTDQEPQPPDPNEDPALAAEIALVQATAATPPGVPPAAPPTADFAKPVASSTLQSVARNLNSAMAGIGSAKTAAGSWTDDFWAVSGYSKDTVLAALTSLEQLAETYNNEYSDDAQVLMNQA